MASPRITVATPALPQEIAVAKTPHVIPKRTRRRRSGSQQGSVRPRKNRRGETTSWIVWYRTREGKLIGKTFKTKTEANNHKLKVVNEIRENKYVDAEAELFSVYAPRWLDRRRSVLKPNSYRTYSTFIKKWLLPVFGDQDVRDITRADVRTFAYQLIQKNHLSGQTISMMLMMLSDLFDSAIDDLVAQTNPAHRLNVDMPDDSEKRHMPSRQDVNATFAQLNSDPGLQVFLLTAALTGLRKGEILGLWWDDIDWRHGTIRVERSLTRAKKAQSESFRNIQWVCSTTFAVVPPKSKTSRRTVIMPKILAELLQQLHGTTNNQSPFVFQQDQTGAPRDPQLIYKPLYEAQARAGVVERFGFHGLRHRFASELSQSGASPAKQRERLGWSSMNMADTYTHDVGDERAHEEAVARLFPVAVNYLSTGGALKQ